MNKEEIQKIVEQLNKDSRTIKESINQLEEDIKRIQAGDGTAYWNGKNAYDSIKTALLQLDYNKDLLKELEKNIQHLSSLS